ncbi:hypothetical protein Tco_0218572 [Tanacetum coccineum]
MFRYQKGIFSPGSCISKSGYPCHDFANYNTNRMHLRCLSVDRKAHLYYAMIFWEDLLNKLKEKTREKVIPYIRFISLLLMQRLQDSYNNDNLTIYPTQTFSANNLALKANQPEGPPFTVHMLAIYEADKAVPFKAPKTSSKVKKQVPIGTKPGVKTGHKKQSIYFKQPSVSSKEETKSTDLNVLAEQTKSVSDGLDIVLTKLKTGPGAEEISSEDILKEIKFEDLAKLVPNVKVNFMNLDSPEDDPVIVVDYDNPRIFVMAILVISISSDSSEDSVGTPAGRVILFESDPSEDPSSDHIPPLPTISPFLSSDDDTTNSDTPYTPPSPTHGTPFTEITASTKISPIIPHRRVMILSLDSPILICEDILPDHFLLIIFLNQNCIIDFNSDASSDSSVETHCYPNPSYTCYKGVQREAANTGLLGLESAVIALTERIAELDRDNRRLRGTTSVENFREYISIEKMPNTRSGASMTHEEVEELVNRRVAEEMEAREAAMNLKPMNENGDEQEGGNGGNGGNGNGGNEGNGNGGNKENGNGGNRHRNGNHGMNYGEDGGLNYGILTVKGNDLTAYTQRFQELILLCTRMVPNEEDRVERFIGGLPDNIQGNVIAANPARL